MPSTDSKRRRIIGICQVRNEDVFIERVLANILAFCDTILVADHHSTDNTAAIAKHFSERDPKISYTLIPHPRDAHELIRPYCNTPSWIFPVDGDEIYDPLGLAKLRPGILSGEFDQYRQFYGHSLHCIDIDFSAKVAKGYMSPPCRTVTKLYNFGALKDWKGPCIEKCLGGEIVFNPGWSETSNNMLIDQFSWDNSPFRLLHPCFMKRSSQQTESQFTRPQVGEIYEVSIYKKMILRITDLMGRPRSSSYKLRKYKRGPLASYDISEFIA